MSFLQGADSKPQLVAPKHPDTDEPGSDGPMVTMMTPEAVKKPWGRVSLKGRPLDWSCGLDFSEAVGEIHHRLPEALPSDALPAGTWAGGDALLVKTLFTAEMLSVQVHPDAARAKALGMARGKDEAWLVLDADPGARIGLGLHSAMTAEALAAAVMDGSIIDAMVWHKVTPGQILSAPAGTVHAIGAGMTVLEFQENNDLTWRLYDLDRGRALNLAEGLEVAVRGAFVAPAPHASPGPGRELHVAGGGFVLERVAGQGRLCPAAGRPVWVAAVSDGVLLDDMSLAAGSVALVAGEVIVEAGGGIMLAQAGREPQADLWIAG